MPNIANALAKSFYAVGETVIDDALAEYAHHGGVIAAEKAASTETDWDDEALEKSALAAESYARGVRETQARLRGVNAG